MDYLAYVCELTRNASVPMEYLDLPRGYDQVYLCSPVLFNEIAIAFPFSSQN